MGVRSVLLSIALVACGHDQDLEGTEVASGALVLESPPAASWMGTGVVEARGTATDVDAVLLNGESASLRDGVFAADVDLVRGVNVVEASAVDARGDEVFARHGVLAGDFANPDGAVKEAIRLRLNQGGLDRLMEIAAGMVDAETVNGAVAGMNPVYEDSYGVWGWDAVTIAADVAQIDFGTPRLVATPEQGTLTLVVTIPDLYVAIDAYGEAVGFDFDTQATMTATAAVVTGTLRVGAEDGRIVASLDGATVELQGFAYDTSLLPGDVETYLFVDTIRGKIEEMLLTQIQERVPPLLEETLAGLDPSFSTELMGLAVDMAFSFAEVEVDRDGLFAALDLDVSVPAAGSAMYAGYLSAGAGDPTLDTAPDLAAAISDDLLNRVLFEAWRGGLLNMTLSTEDGSLPEAMLSSFKADEGSISVRADLPPVIVERGGALQAQVAEMMVTVDTPDGDLGTHLEVAIAMTVDLDVVVEDGELKLGVGTPEIVMAVRDSDWGAKPETVTRVLEENLPLESLMFLLGDISVPIPTLYGIAIDTGTASRDADGVNTGVDVWLE